MLIVRLGLILMLVSSLAAGGLAYLNTVTAPIIAENEARAEQLAREEVAPPGSTLERCEGIDGFEFYKAIDTESGELVGYVGKAQGAGYSSNVKTMVGLDKSMAIVGSKVVFQQETPGLGTKSQEPKFLDQFKGVDGRAIAVKKDGGTIDAITGATITSRCVTNSIQRLVKNIESSLAKEAPEEVIEAEVEGESNEASQEGEGA